MFRIEDSWASANLLMDGLTLLIRVRMGFEKAATLIGAEKTSAMEASFMLTC
jgi:hypothetical protein